MTLALKKTDLAAIALALVVLFGGKLNLPQIAWNDSTPAVSVPAPSAELQAVVSPIAALVIGDKAAADRAELAGLFSALAEFHSRDKATVISTVQLLQRHNELSLQAFYMGTGMKGRYATLGASVDAALGKHLGILQADGKYKAGPLDAATAAKVAEFCKAMAWAFSQPVAAKG